MKPAIPLPTHDLAICILLGIAFGSSFVRPASAYVPTDRWIHTASGWTGAVGTPITLTWSIVPDGTPSPTEEPTNLIAYFDGLFNVTAGGSDLTQRPWFHIFEESFNRWNELGGIHFVYEPNDSGDFMQFTRGELGVRGDLRLGGAPIDGKNGTLAYTWTPDSGDIMFDTGEPTFYSNATNNYRGARNTIMHEIAHAFGLLHIVSTTDNFLLEPTINLSIDGPQLDDIRGIQGHYGDVYEKSNGGLGNGTYQLATPLGSLVGNGSLAIGSDAIGTQAVSPTEIDFVSIANHEDVDFYSFTIAAPSLLDVTLTPLGGVFSQGPNSNEQSTFDANARNDLALAIFASNGTTLLGSANQTAEGGIESLTNISLATAGTYYARITGSTANVQLYELALTAQLLNEILAGDFNQDGVVNAADYSVWRNSIGQTGTSLPADANHDGLVDAGDYFVWRTNYGATLTGSGGIAPTGNVPEPAAGLLASLLFAGALAFHRPRRR